MRSAPGPGCSQIGRDHPPGRSARAGGVISPLRSVRSAAPLRYATPPHRLRIQPIKALDATRSVSNLLTHDFIFDSQPPFP